MSAVWVCAVFSFPGYYPIQLHPDHPIRVDQSDMYVMARQNLEHIPRDLRVRDGDGKAIKRRRRGAHELIE